MKWARWSTLTESTWSTPVRSRVRWKVRIVGTACRWSRNPCAASAMRRACAVLRDCTDCMRGRLEGATDGGPPTSGKVEQLLADGVHDRLHAGVQLELLEDVAHVALDGVLADV